MNDQPYTVVPPSLLQPIQHFRFMDAFALEALNTQYNLRFPSRVLARISRHFKGVERRDPTPCELRFLRALLDDRRASAHSVYLNDHHPADPMHARILADALRMHACLHVSAPQTKLTLPRLLNTAVRYLARADILPCKNDLVWQKAASARARMPQDQRENLPVCGDMALVPLVPQEPLSPSQRILLCLTANDPSCFEQELSAFLSAADGAFVHLHAVVGAEGLMSHLLAQDGSISLNLAALSALSPDALPEALFALREPCALLLCDERSLPALFAIGAPLSVCGTLRAGNQLSFYRGAQRLASFDKSVLHCLNVLRKPATATAATLSPSPKILSQSITERPNALSATLCVEGSCLAPLLALLGDLAARGADFTALCSTLCITHPPADLAAGAIIDALPLALEYHRVAAELSLPGANSTCEIAQNSPRLHLYLSCKRGTPRPDGFLNEWNTAAAAHDFARLRVLVYGN